MRADLGGKRKHTAVNVAILMEGKLFQRDNMVEKEDKYARGLS